MATQPPPDRREPTNQKTQKNNYRQWMIFGFNINHLIKSPTKKKASKPRTNGRLDLECLNEVSSGAAPDINGFRV
jgi:hypothetical protein